MSEAKLDILDKIRHARGGSSDANEIAAALRAIGKPPAAPLDCDSVLETFLLRLAVNKIEVESVANRSEVVLSIAKFLYKEHNTHKVVAGNDRRLAALPWRDGGTLVRFDSAVAADPVSVSYAKLAVAESGSMVLYSNRDNPASNNWLVKDHLIIVEVKDLVASYEEAWAWMRNDLADKEAPRGISFISGPSSTGDIIGHLVRGAHGPQRLRVILLGEVPERLLEQALERAASTKA